MLSAIPRVFHSLSSARNLGLMQHLTSLLPYLKELQQNVKKKGQFLFHSSA